ncbi:MAG: hypothetical protein ACRD5J_07890 [Nitrososphaeraceae archaeon]
MQINSAKLQVVQSSYLGLKTMNNQGFLLAGVDVAGFLLVKGQLR